MRTRSLPLRLDRLTGHRSAGDLDRTVRELAMEYGLEPAEVRAELAEIEAHDSRFGPEPPEQLVRRWAGELGLPEAEHWEEVRRITGAAGGTR